MPVTGARLAEIDRLHAHSRSIATLIGSRPLHLRTVTTRHPRTRSPHLRFVIETAGAAKLASMRRTIATLFGGRGRLAPGVTWRNRMLTEGRRALPGLLTNQAIDVRHLYPGADPADQRFKLANFAVLTIPVDPLAVKQLLHGGTGSLYDLAYTIKDAGHYVRVDPEIPSKGWRLLTPPPAPGTSPSPSPPSTTPGGPRIVPLSSPGTGSTGSNDHAWNLRAIHMPNTGDPLNNGGSGIRVGQVDTGTSTHPELTDVYAPAAQRGCTIDGETDTDDPLPDPGIDQPGHGTATASVLASRGGFMAQEPLAGELGTLGTTNPANDSVTGVATDCTVVPVRSVRLSSPTSRT